MMDPTISLEGLVLFKLTWIVTYFQVSTLRGSLRVDGTGAVIVVDIIPTIVRILVFDNNGVSGDSFNRNWNFRSKVLLYKVDPCLC